MPSKPPPSALYRGQKFVEAADALRAAADDIDSDKVADQLLDRAAGYGLVGNLLSAAEKSTQSDAAAALNAYKRALVADKKVAAGVHAQMISRRIGQVAPTAARLFMAKKTPSGGQARRRGRCALRVRG